jgi:hypothetical protein
VTQRRLVLLVTSPRVAPGILTRAAWQALDTATEILGRDDDAQVEALREAGARWPAIWSTRRANVPWSGS